MPKKQTFRFCSLANPELFFYSSSKELALISTSEVRLRAFIQCTRVHVLSCLWRSVRACLDSTRITTRVIVPNIHLRFTSRVMTLFLLMYAKFRWHLPRTYHVKYLTFLCFRFISSLYIKRTMLSSNVCDESAREPNAVVTRFPVGKR